MKEIIIRKQRREFNLKQYNKTIYEIVMARTIKKVSRLNITMVVIV